MKKLNFSKRNEVTILPSIPYFLSNYLCMIVKYNDLDFFIKKGWVIHKE